MMVIDPAVCARCARLGHPQCLGMERFAGHMFCGRCISNAIAEYSSFRDAHSRENWRRELALQVSTWKARAVQLIGISSTVGVAVGGAVAAAAGAAAGLAQGAVRGAVGAALTPRAMLPLPEGEREPELPALLPPPPPHSEPRPATSTSVALRRSRSYDNLPGKGTHCLACWTANKGHKGHVYAGDCQVIPGRSLWADQRPPDRAALVDQPAVQPQQSIAETAVGPHFTDIPVPEHGSFGSAVSLHEPPLAPHAPSEGEQADSRRFQQLEVNVQELRAELQGTREEMASVVTALAETADKLIAATERVDSLEFERALYRDEEERHD